MLIPVHIFVFLQLENVRRKHNYLPLIMEVLKILAKRGELVGLVEKVRAHGLYIQSSMFHWHGNFKGKEEESRR